VNDRMSALKSHVARFIAIYKGFALPLMNTVAAFIAFNLVLLAIFRLKDGSLTVVTDPVSRSRYDVERLRQVYPNYSDTAIRNLVAETWHRPHQFEPFTQFKEPPFQGTYVNVHAAGFRQNDRQAVWPPEKKNINVFVFGGSTTFGYGVADTETIPAQLEAFLLSKTEADVHVYNFGCGYYFSTQERIRFEQLVLAGLIPDVAVFIDGLNDFDHFDGVPYGTDRLIRATNDENAAAAGLLVSRLPVSRLARGIRRRLWGSEVPREEAFAPDDRRVNMSVIERFERNIELIQALGRSQDVSTVFVWQPSPAYHYDDKRFHLFYDGKYGSFTRTRFGYLEMEAVVKKPRADYGLLWLADLQQELKEPLYVDKVHYTGRFSAVIAKAIGDELLRRGVLKKRRETGIR